MCHAIVLWLWPQSFDLILCWAALGVISSLSCIVLRGANGKPGIQVDPTNSGHPETGACSFSGIIKVSE